MHSRPYTHTYTRKRARCGSIGIGLAAFFIFPVADNGHYSAGLLADFNAKFPPGSELEVIRADCDPGPAPTSTYAPTPQPAVEPPRLRTHWKLAHTEAVANSAAAVVSEGTLENAHPVRVRVATASQGAAFRVAGGVGYVPVSVCGLAFFGAPFEFKWRVVGGSGAWRMRTSVSGRPRCRP